MVEPRQLGDVASYAARLVLIQPLCHVRVMRLLSRIEVCERLAIGVSHL
jgi:hypothetical protein